MKEKSVNDLVQRYNFLFIYLFILMHLEEGILLTNLLIKNKKNYQGSFWIFQCDWIKNSIRNVLVGSSSFHFSYPIMSGVWLKQGYT